MKTIKTVEAEGLELCQDITQIIRGEFKGVAFPKGHRVRKKDIPVLLSLGKEHLYIWSEDESLVHENDAAKYLYDLIAGENFYPTEVKEGKIELVAQRDGLLKVDSQKLYELNSIGDIAVATKTSDLFIKAGEKVAGARIIPLQVEENQLRQASELFENDQIIRLLPFKKMNVGIVTTGSEVAKGLIKDTFTPVVKEKLAPYNNVTIVAHVQVDDQPYNITKAIETILNEGADIVFCTGGMSVDPDDKTPLGIKNTGARIVTHGTPVLPGSMLMLAYLGKKAIVGLPGGVMFSDKTVFDLLLPRLMAQDPITKEEIMALGYGGYL